MIDNKGIINNGNNNVNIINNQLSEENNKSKKNKLSKIIENFFKLLKDIGLTIFGKIISK